MASLFTRIISGEIPGVFVYRDPRCVAIMTINPIARGHVLVMPIEEIDHWLDLPEDLSSHVFAVARHIGKALHLAFNSARVGLIIAGLEIPHCHLHLIPTTSMADLNFANAAQNVPIQEIEMAAHEIIVALSKLKQGL